MSFQITRRDMSWFFPNIFAISISRDRSKERSEFYVRSIDFLMPNCDMCDVRCNIIQLGCYAINEYCTLRRRYNYIRHKSWSLDRERNVLYSTLLIHRHNCIYNCIWPLRTMCVSTSRSNDAHGASAWHIGVTQRRGVKVPSVNICVNIVTF